MKEIANNPAGRLLALLTRAQNLPFQQHTQLGAQFYTLFPFASGPDDYLTFLVEANNIAEVLVDIDRQLHLCDQGQHDLFVSARDRLNGLARIMPLQQSWMQYRNSYLVDADLAILGFVSLTLSREFGESMISGDEIDDLRTKFVELGNAIQGSALNHRLKNYILKSIYQMERALAEYELRGVAGLDEAIGTLIGRAILHPEFAEAAYHGSEPEDTVMPFWQLVYAVAGKMNASRAVQQFTRVLASGSPIDPALSQ